MALELRVRQPPPASTSGRRPQVAYDLLQGRPGETRLHHVLRRTEVFRQRALYLRTDRAVWVRVRVDAK